MAALKSFNMLSSSFLFLLLVFSSAAVKSILNQNENQISPPLRTENEIKSMFESWLVKHGKVYNSIGEKEVRYQIFKDNLRFIDEHNSVDRPYKLGLTPFTDLTNTEYRSLYLGEFSEDTLSLSNYNISKEYEFQVGDVLPDTVDWRKKGAVAPVRSQGRCGGCWAFSAASTVESIDQIANGGDVKSLSPQQLLDCDTKYSKGCNGGFRAKALEYVRDNGLTTESNYPYQGVQNSYCKTNEWTVSIDGVGLVPRAQEKSLQKAVSNQPVAVGIDSRSAEFQNYVSGVFVGPCGTRLDHAVVAVGYGTEDGLDYWLVRNSWGPYWGDKGYVKMQRNVGGVGICGIATNPCYPIIRKSFGLNANVGKVADA